VAARLEQVDCREVAQQQAGRHAADARAAVDGDQAALAPGRLLQRAAEGAQQQLLAVLEVGVADVAEAAQHAVGGGRLAVPVLDGVVVGADAGSSMLLLLLSACGCCCCRRSAAAADGRAAAAAHRSPLFCSLWA